MVSGVEREIDKVLKGSQREHDTATRGKCAIFKAGFWRT